MICTAFLISCILLLFFCFFGFFLHMHVNLKSEYLLHSYVKRKFPAKQNLVFQSNIMISIHVFFQWNLGIKLKFVHVWYNRFSDIACPSVFVGLHCSASSNECIVLSYAMDWLFFQTWHWNSMYVLHIQQTLRMSCMKQFVGTVISLEFSSLNLPEI